MEQYDVEKHAMGSNAVTFGPGSEFKYVRTLSLKLQSLGVDIFSLIYDGRSPCETNGKGYKEGPHFPMAPDNHVCDPVSTAECGMYQFHLERIRRDKTNPNIVFDVILLPDCCKSQINNLKIEGCLSKAYLLLERWFITFVKSDSLTEKPLKEVEKLYQILYSHVHYSQLSSWLSLSNGTCPKSVMYWVNLPGDCMTSFIPVPKFQRFPAYVVTDEVAISVSVCSFPRVEIVPKLSCVEHHMPQASWRSFKHLPSTCKQPICKKKACFGRKASIVGNESCDKNSSTVEDNKKKKGKKKKKKSTVTLSADGSIKKGKLDGIEKFQDFSCSSIISNKNVNAAEILERIPCQKFVGEANDQHSKVKNNSINSEKDHDSSINETRDRTVCSRISSVKSAENSVTSKMTVEDRMQDCKIKPMKTPGQALVFNNPSEINSKSDEADKSKLLNCDLVEHRAENLAAVTKIKRKSSSKSACVRCHKKLCTWPSPAKFTERINAKTVQHNEKKSKEINEQKVTGALNNRNTLDIHDISHQGISGLNSDKKKNFTASSAHETTNECVPRNLSWMLDKPHLAKLLNRNSVTNSAKNFPTATKIKEKSPLKSVNKRNTQEFKVANEKRLCKGSYWGTSPEKRFRKTYTPQVNVNGSHFSGNQGAPSAIDTQYYTARHPTSFDTASMSSQSRLKSSENVAKPFEESYDRAFVRRAPTTTPSRKNKVPSHNGRGTTSPEVAHSMQLRRRKNQHFKKKSVLPKSLPRNHQSLLAKSVRSRFAVEHKERCGKLMPLRNSVLRFAVEKCRKLMPVQNSVPCPDKDEVKKSKPAISKKLLINFEESLLRGCFRQMCNVSGYELHGHIPHLLRRVNFCLPIDVTFYAVDDVPRLLVSLLGVASISEKLEVPKDGLLELAIFKPCGNLLRDFSIAYSLKTIPPNCQTFIRQRTWVIGKDQQHGHKRLAYIVNIWFDSDEAGKVSICKEIKIAITDAPVMPVELNQHLQIETEIVSGCHI